MNVLLNSLIYDDKYGLELHELLMMCILYSKVKFDDIYAHLESMGYVTKSLFGAYTLTPQGSEVVKNIILQSSKSTEDTFDYIECSKALREIYPKGSMIINGTKHPWRCNINEVANALKWLRKNNPSYTREDIITATKRYVESFHGVYDNGKMRILRNFIKLQSTEYDNDGIGHYTYRSELASWIENGEDELPDNANIGEIIYGK